MKKPASTGCHPRLVSTTIGVIIINLPAICNHKPKDNQSKASFCSADSHHLHKFCSDPSCPNEADKSDLHPLGINTKCSTPPLKTAAEKRSERYKTTNIARKLFAREGRRMGLKRDYDYHRTCKCMVVPLSEKIKIHKSKEHDTAFYSGLVVCGSVWSCPICTAKIQERRRVEIAKAMDKAYREGMKCVMITLTFPHLAFDKLQTLVNKQSEAHKRLRAGNPWVRIKESAGHLGFIRSLELTDGENGWHPHTHEIWIVSKSCDVRDLKEKILARWESSCARAGLLDLNDQNKVAAFRKHSVDIKDNASNSDYLAKMDDSRNWGADREIAKASTKKGKSKGLHPFQLLIKYEEGNERAGQRFLEYSRVMKGKRQLIWSKGLKEWAGVDELTDEELAQSHEDNAEEIYEVSKEQWRKVLKLDARTLLLELAEHKDAHRLIPFWLDWLDKHIEKPPLRI